MKLKLTTATLRTSSSAAHIIYLALLCFTFLSSHESQSQTKADSLRVVIAGHKNDTSKVRLLCDLASELFQNGDYFGTTETASEIRELSIKLDYPGGEGRSWTWSGKGLLRTGQYDSAHVHFKKAFEIFVELKDSSNIARTLTFLGQSRDLMAQYMDALRYYELATKVAKGATDNELQVTILNNIGVTFMHLGEFEKALDYFLKAEKIISKLERGRHAAILINIAVIYHELRLYDDAIKYYNITLMMAENLQEKYLTSIALMNRGEAYYLKGQYSLSLNSLERALEIQVSSGDNRGMALSYDHLGNVYKRLNKLSQSETHYRQSLRSAEVTKNNELRIKPMLGLAGLYINRGKFYEAEELIKNSQQLANQTGSRPLLEVVYLKESQLDSARGNFGKAYLSLKKFQQLKDSLLNEKNSKKIIQMRELYENEKKDLEILRLNDAQRNELIQRNSEKNTSMMLSAFAVLIILILIFWLFTKIRHAAILRTQKNEIYNANKNLENLIIKVEAHKRLLQLKNNRLEELHRENDSLIGIVAHDLKSPINRIQGLSNLISMAGELNQEQESLVELIRKVSESGTRLIRDLLEINQFEQEEAQYSNVDLPRFILSLLDYYVRSAEQKNIRLEWEHSADEKIVLSTVENYIARIIDNLLSNAIKFSNPGSSITISVKLDKVDRGAKIILKDEGPGFSAEDLPHLFRKFKKLSARPTAGESSSGLGLSIVKTLVDKLDGTISVQSTPGNGATFTICFPLLGRNVEKLDLNEALQDSRFKVLHEEIS